MLIFHLHLTNIYEMKGLILAGGKGSRLYPLTETTPKALLPIYDKPLIYYPLATLVENGINDVCIITAPEDLNKFKKLLENITKLNIKITYKIQEVPNGIAKAFTIAKDFIKDDDVTLILGDNIFQGANMIKRALSSFKIGGSIFAYEVSNPKRYGVVEFDEKTKKALSIEEKPQSPKSNYAVPGLYIYDNSVIDVANNLKPSARGEYEITDVNKYYMENDRLTVNKINRGCVWFDAGTSSSLFDASEYVRILEKRQGVKTACLEEIALKQKLIKKMDFVSLIDELPNSEYKEYLKKCAV
jgi:glucose-1-phosphate thymidylyltransferase